jgi:bacterial leucyl aminopeptidase
MGSSAAEIVFFDLNTLRMRVCRTDGNVPVLELGIAPATLDVLEALAGLGVRLGITFSLPAVSTEAVAEALKRAGGGACFDPGLIFAGGEGSPAWRAAAAGTHDPEKKTALLFVNASAVERLDARNDGYRTAPHPLLAVSVLRDRDPLRYLRIRVPFPTDSSPHKNAFSPPAEADEDWLASLWRALRTIFSCILRKITAQQWDEDAASRQVDEGWRAVLRDLPLVPLHLATECDEAVDTVYAIGDMATAAELDDLGFLVDRLGAADLPQTTGLYLMHDDQQTASGFLNRTGNSSRLFSRRPDADLLLASIPEGLLLALAPGISPEDFFFEESTEGHILSLSPSPSLLDLPPAETEPELTKALKAARDVLTGLSGEAIDILRREVASKAVLKAVERYSSGTVAVCGGKLIKSRNPKHPHNLHAVCAILEDLRLIGGGKLPMCTLPFTYDRKSLENVEATLPARVGERGQAKQGVVLIGAHLDSTGRCTHSFEAATSDAPGANDNASGMAGVLCAAAAILELDQVLKVPRREIRFVLFNAEETGRDGSRDYVENHAGVPANAMAGLIMDMIGSERSNLLFQLHTGHRGSAVHGPSKLLAELIDLAARKVSTSLKEPAFFHDPDDFAYDRSDHTPFRARGIAACLASQSPFPPSKCGSSNNTYHTTGDLAAKVDTCYAADIARAVAAAAWAVAIA